MKKRLFSVFMLLFIIPCLLILSACGKKEDEKPSEQPQTQTPTTSEITLSKISADLSNDGVGFDYDANTKTFNFEYGTEVDISKDEFNMIASYSDESLKYITDYTLDLSSVSEIPDVGDYKIKLKYSEQEIEFNVHVYPKKIDKPTIQQANSYGYSETIMGESIERTVSLQGFDETTMSYSEDSVFSASNVGDYQIKVVPKSNYVWENFETSETEEVIFDWKIKRKAIYMNSPEALEFTADGTTKEILFTEIKQNQDFSDYFEVASGKTSASEVGKYEFVVKLKDEFIQNYEIFEIKYHEIDGDFKYNSDKTEITYYWSIVSQN